MTTAPGRPYVVLSAAMSVDGYLDDTSDQRLLLSNEADFDRVDAVRAGCDAILVGAETIRQDDPRLLIRDADRRAARVGRGRPENPIKVTLTAGGKLDPKCRFFTTGTGLKLVYCPDDAAATIERRLGGVATVVPVGDPVDLARLLADLAARGVGRLLVEGGGRIHTQLLTGGFADELQLVVAPFFVGEPDAPRLVGAGPFPHHAGHPMELAEARPIGDVVLLRYRLDRRG